MQKPDMMITVTMLQVCMVRKKQFRKERSNHKKYPRRRHDESAAFVCKCLIGFRLSGDGVHPLFLGILGFKLGPYFLLKKQADAFSCSEEVHTQ